MKKLFTLFVAFIATITLWAGNTITYTATEKLSETTTSWEYGLHTNAFDVSITSHTFADGTGTITFNGDVTSIGKSAFSGCSGLTSITIPNSVTSIGYKAFSDCSSLTSITIPNSVTSIGFCAFSGCSGLTSITCEAVTPPACDGWCFISVDKSIPLYVPAESVEAYKTAAEWKDFTNIQPIATQKTEFNTITYTATSKLSETTDEWYDGLHTNAFDVSITSHTFADGTGTITFNGDVTSIGEQAFCSCSGLTSITIPNSVTSIGVNAFSGCSGLTSITIPNSVTSIGHAAFSGCSGLTSIVVESGNINYDSRENCNAIIKTSTNTLIYGCQNTIIPNSVTSIGDGAFYDCSGLTSITIPNSVTSIGNAAFYGCSGLTSITCEAVTPPACGNDCFEYVDHTIPLYVPAESVEAYKTAAEWKDFTNIQPIEPNALDNAIAPTDNLRKFMRDGQVLIERDGHLFNALGAQL